MRIILDAAFVLFLAVLSTHQVVAQPCIGKTGTAGIFALTVESSGDARTYQLTVPSSYRANTAMPVVVNFHGWGGTGPSQDVYTHMSETAELEGFIAVHPDGIGNSWNAGACCGDAVAQGVDDVQFARDLVNAVARDYCVDPARIFATGMSNGGYMSHRLACEASDVFAAVAPASGLLGVDNCDPGRPVPIMQSHGTVDMLVPYDKGLESIAYWVDYNQCSGQTQVVYREGLATCTLYLDCADKAMVEWCGVRGMKHVWPTSTSGPGWIDATDLFWDFFTQNPMPN